MPLRTRLTERLGIKHPIISAPMGLMAGGKLAPYPMPAASV